MLSKSDDSEFCIESKIFCRLLSLWRYYLFETLKEMISLAIIYFLVSKTQYMSDENLKYGVKFQQMSLKRDCYSYSASFGAHLQALKRFFFYVGLWSFTKNTHKCWLFIF